MQILLYLKVCLRAKITIIKYNHFKFVSLKAITFDSQRTALTLVNICTMSASVKYGFSFELSHILETAFLVRIGCRRFNSCNTDSTFSFITQFTPGTLRSPSEKHCGMLLSINIHINIWHYTSRSSI